jgi:hypothetical protein
MAPGHKVEIEATVFSRTPMKKTKTKKARAKPRPEKAQKVPKVGEEELVKETILAQAGVHFEVIAPHPAFPLPVEKLDWFMRCRIKEEILAAPYLNAAWKEKGGPIWLESLAVGDTLDWIELAYGADQAEASLNTDYSNFSDASFKADFSQRFPIVMRRVKEYEDKVAAVGKKNKVRLELRQAGSKGLLVFTIAARVDTPKAATQVPLENALKKAVEGLNEAYNSIEKLEG